MIDNALERRLALLKPAARRLMMLPAEKKNAILREIADRLLKNEKEILIANHQDILSFDERAAALGAAFRDRLTLNPERLKQMADSIRAVADLPDPVGEEVETRTLANGLKIRRVRAPLGSILMIFESRPNVITEVFALAFKSGNAIALRGGSDSRATAALLYRLISEVLERELDTTPGDGSPTQTLPFVGIEDYDRALVGRLLQRSDIFDICIPRGGSALIDRVTTESKMPVIKNDKGVCHLYLHSEGDIAMATAIAINGKTQRPGVCNSLETILVDRLKARDFYQAVVPALAAKGVMFHVCESSHLLLQEIARTDHVESAWMTQVRSAKDEDFYREYLDLIVNLKIVDGFDAAVLHISKYGSHHSESIITTNEAVARRFQGEIDSACVYWNASTRFTDGYELGLGGEIGISTQKLHVRGPVGLRELTSPRWWIDGTGQVRV